MTSVSKLPPSVATAPTAPAVTPGCSAASIAYGVPSLSAPASSTSREEVNITDLDKAHTRIIALEGKVASLEKALAAERKRKATGTLDNGTNKKSKGFAASASSLALAGAPPPVASAKSTKLVRSKINQGIKNSLKGVKFHESWDRTDRSVTVNDFCTYEEFTAVFGDHGTLIQPTPSNKPKSKVYIKQLGSSEMNAALGNASDHTYKAELWTKGGQPSRGFGGFFGRGGGGGFTKGHKIKGGTQVGVTSAEVKYSNTGANTLHIKVTLLNGGDLDEEYDSDY